MHIQNVYKNTPATHRRENEIKFYFPDFRDVWTCFWLVVQYTTLKNVSFA